MSLHPPLRSVLEQSAPGRPVSRSEFSADPATLAGLTACVREVVAAYRSLGCKVEAAHAQAAPDLGITERRVKAWIYGEVLSVCDHEAARIRAGFRAHLSHEAARLTARAAQLQARSDALQHKDDHS